MTENVVPRAFARAVVTRAMLVIALVVGLTSVMAVGTAQAATGAPISLAPQGGSAVNGSPVLSWGRVLDATSYDVEVAVSSSFTTPLFTKTTTNRQIVPTVQLPEGPVFWRVRANGPAGASAWVTADVTVSATLPPTPTAPAKRRPRPGPAARAAAAQRGRAVKGATSYQVEVDPDGDFVGAADLHDEDDVTGRARPEGRRHLQLARPRAAVQRPLHRLLRPRGPSRSAHSSRSRRSRPPRTPPSRTSTSRGARSREPRPTSCRSAPTRTSTRSSTPRSTSRAPATARRRRISTTSTTGGCVPATTSARRSTGSR